jgi:hypothetical protein
MKMRMSLAPRATAVLDAPVTVDAGLSANSLKRERTERSRQGTENKGEQVSHRMESRQATENKRFIFVKPWSY